MNITYPGFWAIIEQQIPHFGLLIPEIWLFIFALFILTTAIFKPKVKAMSFYFGLLSVFACIYLSISKPASEGNLFAGMLQITAFANKMILLADFSAALAFIFLAIQTTPIKNAEVVSTLLLTMLAGIHLVAFSAHYLMAYLSLELVSLSAYLLSAFSSDKKSAEASVKYLLFGATASAFMLYGFSWLYGFSGSLQIDNPVLFSLFHENKNLFPLVVALVFSIAGILFKISSFPFQAWTPDVYQAGPVPIVAFFSIGPKVAGFVLLLRMVVNIPQEITHYLIATLAILSLLFGNFGALGQKDYRRMLGYSAIAQSGFILLAVVARGSLAENSIWYYFIVYTFASFGSFLIIEVFNQSTNPSTKIADYAGFGKKFPLIGVAVLIIMLALTGLPPTAGFLAKFLVFNALANAKPSNNLTWYLLFFGAINTLPALYYYLKIPYYMFFKYPKNDLNPETEKHILGRKMVVFIYILATILLLLFFIPGIPEWLNR